MIKELSIIIPTLEYKQQAMEYRQEHLNNGEEILSGSSGLHRYEVYEEWLNYIENLRNDKESDWLPATTYFGICDNNIVGTITIKHRINDNMREHISYGVHPSERRKGYATKMLALALNECKKLELKRVFITCDKNDIGSTKTIINNGGILESEFVEEDGEIGQWYWIDVK